MYGALRLDAAGLFSEADHVCWRCASIAEYRAVSALFAEGAGGAPLGRRLIETMIGGRPIAAFELAQPLELRFRVRARGAGGASEVSGAAPPEEEVVRRIGCLEVPCPKPGRFYAGGWEHVEWVVGVGRLDALLAASGKPSPPGGEKEEGHPAGRGSDGAASRACAWAVGGAEPIHWDLRAYRKHVNRDISHGFTFAPVGGGEAEGSFKIHEEALPAVVAAELASGDVEPVPEGYFERHA